MTTAVATACSSISIALVVIAYLIFTYFMMKD